MVMLIWGAPGERRYETGTDRGVLYLPGYPGIAWNGLTAVNENLSGGDPEPYYLDGIKYLNLSTAEEFEASIEAFSAPMEFSICEGAATLGYGVFVTQQPKQSFGFSYRTQVGNDIKGSDYGYKIHIVYNALAKASNRAHATIGESTELLNLSWDITTLPPKVTGSHKFKPTAHLIVDTTQMNDPSMITNLENVLYGGDGNVARLPTPEEVLSLVIPPD